MQARREPQRGPGNHYRGALSITTSFCMRRYREAEGIEGGGTWGGVLLHHPIRNLGSAVSSPSGVWGGAPAEIGFYAYLRSERSHFEHAFQYF